MEIKVLSNFRACWIVAAGEERAGAAVFHTRRSTPSVVLHAFLGSQHTASGRRAACKESREFFPSFLNFQSKS